MIQNWKIKFNGYMKNTNKWKKNNQQYQKYQI